LSSRSSSLEVDDASCDPDAVDCIPGEAAISSEEAAVVVVEELEPEAAGAIVTFTTDVRLISRSQNGIRGFLEFEDSIAGLGAAASGPARREGHIDCGCDCDAPELVEAAKFPALDMAGLLARRPGVAPPSAGCIDENDWGDGGTEKFETPPYGGV
jgi:hypothetical protein